MQIILSILLYLNVISSPGSYYRCEIAKDVSANQSSVYAVQSNSALLNNIVSTYKTKVTGIVILDDGQLK